MLQNITKVPGWLRARAHRRHLQHFVSSREQYAVCPCSLEIYAQLLCTIRNRTAMIPTSFGTEGSESCRFYVRHDIDTFQCVENLRSMIAIDQEHSYLPGVYFRADDAEYSLANCRTLISLLVDEGIEVGLHTVCYAQDHYLKAFREETEKFHRDTGVEPTTFTVHGLGPTRVNVRAQFCRDIAERMDEFGYRFTDSLPTADYYDYVIEDCHKNPETNERFIYDDFLRPPSFLGAGRRCLLLTHPCYWTLPQ